MKKSRKILFATSLAALMVVGTAVSVGAVYYSVAAKKATKTSKAESLKDTLTAARGLINSDNFLPSEYQLPTAKVYNDDYFRSIGFGITTPIDFDFNLINNVTLQNFNDEAGTADLKITFKNKYQDIILPMTDFLKKDDYWSEVDLVLPNDNPLVSLQKAVPSYYTSQPEILKPYLVSAADANVSSNPGVHAYISYSNDAKSILHYTVFKSVTPKVGEEPKNISRTFVLKTNINDEKLLTAIVARKKFSEEAIQQQALTPQEFLTQHSKVEDLFDIDENNQTGFDLLYDKNLIQLENLCVNDEGLLNYNILYNTSSRQITIPHLLTEKSSVQQKMFNNIKYSTPSNVKFFDQEPELFRENGKISIEALKEAGFYNIDNRLDVNRVSFHYNSDKDEISLSFLPENTNGRASSMVRTFGVKHFDANDIQGSTDDSIIAAANYEGVAKSTKIESKYENDPANGGKELQMLMEANDIFKQHFLSDINRALEDYFKLIESQMIDQLIAINISEYMAQGWSIQDLKEKLLAAFNVSYNYTVNDGGVDFDFVLQINNHEGLGLEKIFYKDAHHFLEVSGEVLPGQSVNIIKLSDPLYDAYGNRIFNYIANFDIGQRLYGDIVGVENHVTTTPLKPRETKMSSVLASARSKSVNLASVISSVGRSSEDFPTDKPIYNPNDDKYTYGQNWFTSSNTYLDKNYFNEQGVVMMTALGVGSSLFTGCAFTLPNIYRSIANHMMVELRNAYQYSNLMKPASDIPNMSASHISYPNKTIEKYLNHVNKKHPLATITGDDLAQVAILNHKVPATAYMSTTKGKINPNTRISSFNLTIKHSCCTLPGQWAYSNKKGSYHLSMEEAYQLCEVHPKHWEHIVDDYTVSTDVLPGRNNIVYLQDPKTLKVMVVSGPEYAANSTTKYKAFEMVDMPKEASDKINKFLLSKFDDAFLAPGQKPSVATRFKRYIGSPKRLLKFSKIMTGLGWAGIALAIIGLAYDISQIVESQTPQIIRQYEAPLNLDFKMPEIKNDFFLDVAADIDSAGLEVPTVEDVKKLLKEQVKNAFQSNSQSKNIFGMQARTEAMALFETLLNRDNSSARTITDFFNASTPEGRQNIGIISRWCTNVLSYTNFLPNQDMDTLILAVLNNVDGIPNEQVNEDIVSATNTVLANRIESEIQKLLPIVSGPAAVFNSISQMITQPTAESLIDGSYEREIERLNEQFSSDASVRSLILSTYHNVYSGDDIENTPQFKYAVQEVKKTWKNLYEICQIYIKNTLPKWKNPKAPTTVERSEHLFKVLQNKSNQLLSEDNILQSAFHNFFVSQGIAPAIPAAWLRLLADYDRIPQDADILDIFANFMRYKNYDLTKYASKTPSEIKQLVEQGILEKNQVHLPWYIGHPYEHNFKYDLLTTEQFRSLMRFFFTGYKIVDKNEKGEKIEKPNLYLSQIFNMMDWEVEFDGEMKIKIDRAWRISMDEKSRPKVYIKNKFDEKLGTGILQKSTDDLVKFFELGKQNTGNAVFTVSDFMDTGKTNVPITIHTNDKYAESINSQQYMYFPDFQFSNDIYNNKLTLLGKDVLEGDLGIFFGMPHVPQNWAGILVNNLFKRIQLPAEDRGHGLPGKLEPSKQYMLNEFGNIFGHFLSPYFQADNRSSK